MNKDNKKPRNIQLYIRFSNALMKKGLKCVEKNIILQIFGAGIFSENQKIRIKKRPNSSRMPSHLDNILENFTFEDGAPIFSHLSYKNGYLNYSFSQKSVEYFEWSENKHQKRKETKKEKGEKYIIVNESEYFLLRSKHAKTIYLLMLGWTDTQRLILSRNKIELLFGKRKNKDIRKDVLIPAIEEINEKTSFNIEKWSLNYFSSLNIDFDLFVKKEPKKQEDYQEKEIKISAEERKKLIAVRYLCEKLGQSVSFSLNAYDRLGWECLDSITRFILHKYREGKIHNLEGYTYVTIRKKIKKKQRDKIALSKIVY